MPLVSLSEWNLYLEEHPNGHILQSGEWGELKAAFGWQAIRVVNGNAGVQILLRSLPLGFTLAYLPKPISLGNFQLLGGTGHMGVGFRSQLNECRFIFNRISNKPSCHSTSSNNFGKPARN
jgi:hypothetical protein